MKRTTCSVVANTGVSMLRRATAAALLAALLAGCASAPLSTPTPVATEAKRLRVIVFPGGFNWPLWVAESKGLFARQNLVVSVTPTPNSTFQLKGLIQGDFDLAMTAMDNVIAYREGQGEAGVDGPDLVAVMGSDTGFLRLVSVPEVRTYADLRGKTLSVDALTTGYAFVLREMLERNGLMLGRDYQTERAGGVMQRFGALMERKHAATMLVSPFEVAAQAKGFHVLGNASEALGSYQGVVAAVRQGWASSNAPAVEGYIRAFAEAVDWLYEPANKDEAVRIFLANMPAGTGTEAAETAYRIMLAPNGGFQKQGKLDLKGVETVARLRSKFNQRNVAPRPAGTYYDSRFHDAVMRAWN
ncbi:ABC transporter substrate-binding protein [Ottowia sp.]|uniref:ABC transporter substrate-binding protein n=1 Tax=Ottowia sp. TaxID=1898956 RepID=UPI0039E5735F